MSVRSGCSRRRLAPASSRRAAARRWLQEHHLIGERWPTRLADDQVFVAVLDFDDGTPELVVGYLVLELSLPIATVDQVYVIPDARELGFGDALLDVATAAAVDAGAHVIEGFALPGDRNTKNLYERAGITARLITVSRPLRLVSGPSSSGAASR